MLKKLESPSYVSTPLAFGLGYAFTGGDKEADNNMILDSQVINRTNEILAILPDTPESEVAELVATTFDTLWAGAIQPLIKVFKTLKNVQLTLTNKLQLLLLVVLELELYQIISKTILFQIKQKNSRKQLSSSICFQSNFINGSKVRNK